VARLECSLQPVAGETCMRQEVDIRYVVTSLKGSPQHLYENVYCQRGQMENLIKLHKGTRPVKAAFPSAVAREIVGPLTCASKGTHDDRYGSFRPRATTAMGFGREGSDRGRELGS
jgi:hypothetical protein